MRFLLFTLLILCLPQLAAAQEADSQFADYRAYDAYVDKMITTRQWVDFVTHMGGRDEYTAEDLAKIEEQFNRLFPRNFAARTIFREDDLGGGMRREARAYWGAGRYLFFYAIMHQRNDMFVVLNFTLDTKVEAIMNKF